MFFTPVNSTGLYIENNTNYDFCIGMMQSIIKNVNGVPTNYIYIRQPEDCYFEIASNDTFFITDGNILNRQLPFLNIFPFAGNVLKGPGIISELPQANLPLPVSFLVPDFLFYYIKMYIKDIEEYQIGLPIEGQTMLSYSDDYFGIEYFTFLDVHIFTFDEF